MILTLDISARQAELLRQVVFDAYLHAQSSARRLVILMELKAIAHEMQERANDCYNINTQISEQLQSLIIGDNEHAADDRHWKDQG